MVDDLFEQSVERSGPDWFVQRQPVLASGYWLFPDAEREVKKFHRVRKAKAQERQEQELRRSA